MKKALAMILVLFLAACGGQALRPTPVTGRGMEKTTPDRDPVRRVILVYPRTNEVVDVVYFHNGRYDAAAMKKINTLMRDRHVDAVAKIDPELIDYMVDLRKRMALPQTVPFQILSGYRSPKTNARLAKTNGNVATESLHMYGWAVDFRIDGVDGRALAEIAKTMQRGGVAFYPASNHIHVDLGNIRTWPGKGQ